MEVHSLEMGGTKPTFVKICGITRLTDARAAVRAGANAIGFMFAKSPRRISPLKASLLARHVHPSIKKIGVFVNRSLDEIFGIVDSVGLDGIQLQGDETPEMIDSIKKRDPSLFVAKVLRADAKESLSSAGDFSADAIFFDTKDPSRPEIAAPPVPIAWMKEYQDLPLVVAGGLNPENVGKVIKKLHPWGVDVSRGVESKPGKKDPDKIRAFVRAVRAAES